MVEQQVTDYIQKNFHFVLFRAESKEARLDLEARMIATVSLCRECVPSQNWLGLHSPKAKIRTSGMWQVNRLYGEPLSDSNWSSLEPRESPEDSA